jgi:hypothetical protein
MIITLFMVMEMNCDAKKKKKKSRVDSNRLLSDRPTLPDLSHLRKASEVFDRGEDPIPFVEAFLASAQGVRASPGGYIEQVIIVVLYSYNFDKLSIPHPQARGFLADRLRERGNFHHALTFFNAIIASEVSCSI